MARFCGDDCFGAFFCHACILAGANVDAGFRGVVGLVAGQRHGITIRRLFCPRLHLGFGLSAILTRMTRTSLLEVLNDDFIRTARAKGLSEKTVIVRHALRAALLPIITIVGLQMGSLLAGTVITETIFSWDGIGRLLVESIEKRDYPVTQACVLVVALSYVLVNLFTDIIVSIC